MELARILERAAPSRYGTRSLIHAIVQSDLFQQRHISRLVIKARMADLRAMAAGRITRDAAAAKMLEEEY
jgi:hypothetical protein